MSTTTKIDTASTLQHVVEATLSSKQGFVFLSSQAVRDVLTEHPGSIQVDIGTRDDHGNVAARATSEGITAAFGGQPHNEPDKDSHIAHTSKTRFVIEEGYDIPSPRRGIQAEPRYPFNLLNVGQSFMVPATPERPAPWKALASTVSSANKRMARLKPAKKFIIRPVEEKGVKGARIWRIE